MLMSMDANSTAANGCLFAERCLWLSTTRDSPARTGFRAMSKRNSGRGDIVAMCLWV